MTSRADGYTRAGLIGSLTLLALFIGVTSGVRFILDAVVEAVDSVPATVAEALQESPVVSGISAIISLTKTLSLT